MNGGGHLQFGNVELGSLGDIAESRPEGRVLGALAPRGEIRTFLKFGKAQAMEIFRILEPYFWARVQSFREKASCEKDFEGLRTPANGPTDRQPCEIIVMRVAMRPSCG